MTTTDTKTAAGETAAEIINRFTHRDWRVVVFDDGTYIATAHRGGSISEQRGRRRTEAEIRLILDDEMDDREVLLVIRAKLLRPLRLTRRVIADGVVIYEIQGLVEGTANDWEVTDTIDALDDTEAIEWTEGLAEFAREREGQ